MGMISRRRARGGGTRSRHPDPGLGDPGRRGAHLRRGRGASVTGSVFEAERSRASLAREGQEIELPASWSGGELGTERGVSASTTETGGVVARGARRRGGRRGGREGAHPGSRSFRRARGSPSNVAGPISRRRASVVCGLAPDPAASSSLALGRRTNSGKRLRDFGASPVITSSCRRLGRRPPRARSRRRSPLR